jgi:GntP family gluconate:H+ symporter
MTHDTRLLLVAATAVIGLVVLIARFKWHSFIALTFVSLVAGVAAGGDPASVARTFSEGLGAVLGNIAAVIGLGTVLGNMLAESGAAELIALTLVRACGERWTPWSVACAAFMLGIPVFFGVGVVLLVPIILPLAKNSQTSILRYGLPLVVGLSVAHGLVPPHPGPIAAVALLDADMGKTIGYSLLVGFPTVLVCGPLFGSFLARRYQNETLVSSQQPVSDREQGLNSSHLGLALFTVLSPVLLMLGSTVTDVTLPKESTLRRWADLFGNPTVAMLVAVLLSFWSLGVLRGCSMVRIGKFSEECLGSIASVLLVVGAGGGFSRVLVESGTGEAVAAIGRHSGISPLLLGWLLAALVRVATGSSTVAITTTAGLLASFAKTPGVPRELLLLSMGAGSLFLSHVNDAGFWIVKEFLNLSVVQTLKTWTILETAISLLAFLLIFLLSLLA